MVNALVVRRNTQLAKAQKALRAAQYVRMSTDLQRYSTQNQAAAIAAYAQQRNLTIVRTYVDEGRSGVRINRRPGLIELIKDVQSGNTAFEHILVYDVSRWGRFQDVDESAHYEFVCRRSGVKVAYCAEQFENDGSLLSSILKNIKRVMAAEFSRELGVKVHTGHCRIASLGYRVGGPLTFGLARHGSKIISFQVVRRMARRTPNHVALWRAHLRKERTKLCVFLRLKESNKVVQDYVLLPAADTAKPYLTLSDGALARHKAVCADTMNELIRNIEAKFKSSSHAAPSKPTRPNKRRKPCRPKTKNVHARR
jgi:predicted site-specific integrase-resolvase